MQIYLVGGAVRDKLLHYPVYDKDWVVVGATPQEMLDQGFKPVGSDFPVFIHPTSHEEYALARTERKSGKGYMGFQYHASPDVTLEEDLSRRDLTINAMAESIDGVICDPYGGQADLNKRLLRHVSPAFEEDPLRVLRVARFAARYAHLGFEVAPETLELMKKIAHTDELEHLTKERIWQELERALNERHPLTFFSVLNQADALEKLFPALQPLANDAIANVAQQHFSNTSSCIRFAVLCFLCFSDHPDATNKLSELCEQLRCPNLFKETALQLLQAFPVLSEWSKHSAQTRHQLITQLDLLRRPERSEAIISGCKILNYATGQPEFNANILLNLLTRLKAIKPADLIQQGFKGAALGEEIKRLQIIACKE